MSAIWLSQKLYRIDVDILQKGLEKGKIMWPFRKKNNNSMVSDNASSRLQSPRTAQISALKTSGQISSLMDWSQKDIQSGRFKTMLYRFLTDNIPTVHACIWTWVRLSASPGQFIVDETESEKNKQAAGSRLKLLSERLSYGASGNPQALTTFLTDLYYSLYRDGLFGGFLTVRKDASGIDQFIAVDPIDIRLNEENSKRELILESANGETKLDRLDFYYIPLNVSQQRPLGSSILQAIPFVSAIEQQLVNDMRRAVHNSGYHRLHVKISPPNRNTGESDNAYIKRINEYFDSTVRMMKGLDVDDNPVTWDNVLIEHLGPNSPRSVSNSWFLNHRAMIEEICAGTNLAPFMLGYSYGATTTWSAFKFDLIMRQVRSIQSEVSQFLAWIGNIDLALAGIDARCRYEFDNSCTYQATDESVIKSKEIDNVLKLYQAGLIDEKIARTKAGVLV